MGTTPTAKYAIDLEDGTSGAADSAANSLSRLKDKIGQDTKALSEMRKAMRNLKGSTSVTSGELERMKTVIDAQKATLGASQLRFIKLGGEFGRTEDKSAGALEALKGLTEVMSGGETATKSLHTKTAELTKGFLSGETAIAGLSSKMSALATKLISPAALIGAITVALGALVTATISAIAILARYGLAQSGARREEALRLEGMNSLRAQYGRVTASVSSMQAAIDNANDATGLGRSRLEGYARQLTRVGFRGEALTQALEGTALAASVQGERGAARFRAMAINASIAGRSVRDLADDYRARLGPIARRQMLGLDRQSDRLRAGLDRIFSGLRIESFLGALSEITDIFRASSITGRALKSLVEGILQPLFDGAGTLGPMLKRLFQGMVIGALTVGIAFLRLRNSLRETFGDSELFSNAELMNIALKAGEAVVLGIAFAFIVLGGALTLVAGFLALVASAAVTASAMVMGIPLAVAGIVAALRNWLHDSEFQRMGENIIAGIVAGLRSGTSLLLGQVGSLATGIMDAFSDALGISSPSRVFEGFGVNITQGVVRGVTRGAGEANEAAGNLLDGAETGAGRAVGGATSISIGDVHINAGDTSEPRELAERFRDELASVLEGVGIELGVPT